MNRKEAEQLNILLLRVSAQLARSVHFVEETDTDENAFQYKKAIGKIISHLFLSVQGGLWQRFPDLKPDYLGGPYKSVDRRIHETEPSPSRE